MANLQALVLPKMQNGMTAMNPAVSAEKCRNNRTVKRMTSRAQLLDYSVILNLHLLALKGHLGFYYYPITN